MGISFLGDVVRKPLFYLWSRGHHGRSRLGATHTHTHTSLPFRRAYKHPRGIAGHLTLRPLARFFSPLLLYTNLSRTPNSDAVESGRSAFLRLSTTALILIARPGPTPKSGLPGRVVALLRIGDDPPRCTRPHAGAFQVLAATATIAVGTVRV